MATFCTTYDVKSLQMTLINLTAPSHCTGQKALVCSMHAPTVHPVHSARISISSKGGRGEEDSARPPAAQTDISSRRPDLWFYYLQLCTGG